MPAHDAVRGALQRVMSERRWSGRRLAMETRVSVGWVSNVLAGTRSPSFVKMMDVLARAGYRLVLVDEDMGAHGGNVRRRRFLIEVGAVAGAVPLGVAQPLSSGIDDLRDPEQVTAAARRYVRLERELGGGAAYVPAARIGQQLQRHLNSGRVDAAYIRAVGWYHLEVAWLAYDSGEPKATHAYGKKALTLACRVDDLQLQARACNVLSLAATSAKDGFSAAALATRGLAAAHGDAESERTLLWARLARAEAVQGPKHERAALSALDHAHDAATDARQVYEAVANRGIVLADSGRLDQARRQLAEAAGLIGRLGEPRNRCLYIGRSARVAVRQGSLEEAADLVGQVLDEAADMNSARVDGHLREWMVLTSAPRIAAVANIRDARERVRDHLTPALASDLPVGPTVS